MNVEKIMKTIVEGYTINGLTEQQARDLRDVIGNIGGVSPLRARTLDHLWPLLNELFPDAATGSSTRISGLTLG